jgi:hypothetical protein
MAGALLIVFLIIAYWLTIFTHIRNQKRLRKLSRMKLLIQSDHMEKTLAYIAYSLLGLTVIELIDYSIRVTAGALGILLTIYLIQKTRSGIRVDRLNAEIKEQELWEKIESNNRLSMEKKRKKKVK